MPLEIRHKPRIAEIFDTFSLYFREGLEEDLLLDCGCMAVAVYLFGPLSPEEEPLYCALIKKRLLDYRLETH
jgi:hypothetical protein